MVMLDVGEILAVGHTVVSVDRKQLIGDRDPIVVHKINDSRLDQSETNCKIVDGKSISFQNIGDSGSIKSLKGA